MQTIPHIKTLFILVFLLVVTGIGFFAVKQRIDTQKRASGPVCKIGDARCVVSIDPNEHYSDFRIIVIEEDGGIRKQLTQGNVNDVAVFFDAQPAKHYTCQVQPIDGSPGCGTSTEGSGPICIQLSTTPTPPPPTISGPDDLSPTPTDVTPTPSLSPTPETVTVTLTPPVLTLTPPPSTPQPSPTPQRVTTCPPALRGTELTLEPLNKKKDEGQSCRFIQRWVCAVPEALKNNLSGLHYRLAIYRNYTTLSQFANDSPRFEFDAEIGIVHTCKLEMWDRSFTTKFEVCSEWSGKQRCEGSKQVLIPVSPTPCVPQDGSSGVFSLLDFERFRRVFTGQTTLKQSFDANCDSRIDLFDFEFLRRRYR